MQGTSYNRKIFMRTVIKACTDSDAGELWPIHFKQFSWVSSKLFRNSECKRDWLEKALSQLASDGHIEKTIKAILANSGTCNAMDVQYSFGVGIGADGIQRGPERFTH
jgi:hypothetical protein